MVQAERSKNRGSFPQSVQAGRGATQRHVQKLPSILSKEVKWPQSEADRLIPFSAEVRNGTFLHGVHKSIIHEYGLQP
jgi:hypothetical protein